MTMIKSACKCELPLWKTFWLLHVLGTMLLISLGVTAAAAKDLAVLNPSVGTLVTVAVLIAAYLWGLFTLFLTLGNAGNATRKLWTILAQAYVVINILVFFVNIFV